MTTRTATVDDLDGIREVAEHSWETDYPDILTRETATAGVDDWYAPDRLSADLDRKKTLLLTADRDGDVVGFAHATWNDDEGHLLRLYVDPDHRREGVGRDLLVGVCDALFDRDVERINAMVLSANDPGKAFYERFGFEYQDEAETTIGGEGYPESRYVLEERSQLQVD